MTSAGKIIAASLCLTIVGLVTELTCAAEVQVRLKDGRLLRGSLVEPLCNEEQITLEARSPGILMRRTLASSQVATKRISPAMADEEPKPLVAAQRPEHKPPAHRAADRVAKPPRTQPSSSLSHQVLADADELPLAELLVTARPISTYGRMDWDALRLSVRGFDQRGVPVPLFGTLQITLWGLRVEPGRLDKDRYGELYQAVPRDLEKLGTWTRQLDSNTERLAGTAVTVGGRQDRGRTVDQDDPSDVMQLILPLPQPLPDIDARRWPLGEVSVELLMPGVGVFSAASPGVMLVHHSPLRQFLLERDGTRFFPNEGTTNSQQSLGDLTNRALWPERRVLTIQP